MSSSAIAAVSFIRVPRPILDCMASSTGRSVCRLIAVIGACGVRPRQQITGEVTARKLVCQLVGNPSLRSRACILFGLELLREHARAQDTRSEISDETSSAVKAVQ